MKKYGLIFLSLICLLILTSCTNENFLYQPKPYKEDFFKETWMYRINSNPSNWLCHADRWFVTGMPNNIEQCLGRLPMHKAVSKMHLRITNFQNIVTKGSYQIQIVRGDCDRIYIIGPNEQVRQISVTIFGNTLFINQAANSKQPLNRVIVRISMRCLRNLVNAGSGGIYGRDIISNRLMIRGVGKGEIMLVGNMNLCQINQLGAGKIVVIGANAPSTNIKIGPNGGNVSVSGRVGIRNIYHAGYGCLNIIGAYTNSLSITASGRGATAIIGYINLKKIMASNYSRVYLYWVMNPATFIYTRDKARVGLAGKTCDLNVDASGSSRVLGQNFYANNAYVRAFGNAHINVAATRKAFAYAGGNGSVYFFGAPTILSKYTNGRGTIVPVWNNGNCTTFRPTMMVPQSRRNECN